MQIHYARESEIIGEVKEAAQKIGSQVDEDLLVDLLHPLTDKLLFFEDT